MSKKMLYLLCCVSVSLLCISCAPSTKVAVTKPAEINLKGVDKIVVGKIGGNNGIHYADLLTTRLFESDKFEVLDRDNLDRVMGEHQLNASGVVDPQTAIKIGKIIGASALVVGNVNQKYTSKRWKDKQWRDKKGKYHQNHYIEGVARINANLKVVDLTTGVVLAVKSISTQAKDRNRSDGQYPEAPDRDELITDATSESLEKFMKMIAPFTIYVTVKFEKTKSPEGKNAIQMAKNGLWKDALALFETDKNNHPDNPKAWYNLGVCYQYNYMFREARNAFKECNKIKASTKCLQGIKNVKKMEREQERLRQQGVDASKN